MQIQGRQFDSKDLEAGKHCAAEIIDYDVEVFEERGDNTIEITKKDVIKDTEEDNHTESKDSESNNPESKEEAEPNDIPNSTNTGGLS